MGIEFSVDIDIDKGEFQAAVADQLDEHVSEWLETDARDGAFECDCGSSSFDIETWNESKGEIKAAGVCRECNERMNIEVDTSEIDDLRG